MLTVELLHGVGSAQQQEYVLRNPSSLLYVNPDFISLIAKHLGANAGWLVAKRQNEIAGLLPFVSKEGPWGTVFNSMAYYGSNGGVIQSSPDLEAKGALVDVFFNVAKSAEACSATIITNPLEQDAFFYEECTNYHYRDERIGQITHFPKLDDLEALSNIFEDPRPRNIRHAIKQGIEIQKSNDAGALDFLFDTHVANMQSIGGLAKSREFFHAILHDMPTKDWAVFTAILNEKPVTALLLFYFNKTVEYYTPVIVEEHRNTQALALTIYRAMQDALTTGYKNWI